MKLIRLDSLDDPRLAPYRNLPQSNLTVLSGRFVVEGKLMVERLVDSAYEVESIVVDERRLAMVPARVSPEVPLYVLPARGVEQLIGFNFHRGILACGRRRPAVGLLEWAQSLGRVALIVVCVDIQDPTNLGGILRNSAAFGVEGVLLNPSCADAFSRRVLRVSMGTAFRLRIMTSRSLAQDLKTLQQQFQFELVATVLDASAERLETAQRGPRMALLIGNEGHGLGGDWIHACQRLITLPMEHGTDSLNVAAASAVFLYHFTRVAHGVVAPAPAASGD